MPAYFSRETMRFLADLAKHNERAWFEPNKARYEALVKEPAGRLVAEVGSRLRMEGKVMRIYRDTRFSKDKTPYKTNVGLSWHPPGPPRGPLLGGVYLHVSPRESFVAAGAWHPERDVLGKIRDAIVEKPAAWAKARKVGLDEDEDTLARAPRGFDPEHKLIDDLKRRNFTASVDLTDAQVTSDALPKLVVDAEKRLRPLNAFLVDAAR
ncbi:MAG: hypothetical protein QOE90_1071 [Thermoplasmata archaeon]|jgi:uncharacterized protein (TIGR02453 family)|nr:hypothetical protein [Thermoplasmata archaeon]